MNLFLLVNNVFVYHQMTRISRTFVSFDSSDVFLFCQRKTLNYEISLLIEYKVFVFSFVSLTKKEPFADLPDTPLCLLSIIK